MSVTVINMSIQRYHTTDPIIYFDVGYTFRLLASVSNKNVLPAELMCDIKTGLTSINFRLVIFWTTHLAKVHSSMSLGVFDVTGSPFCLTMCSAFEQQVHYSVDTKPLHSHALNSVLWTLEVLDKFFSISICCYGYPASTLVCSRSPDLFFLTILPISSLTEVLMNTVALTEPAS